MKSLALVLCACFPVTKRLAVGSPKSLKWTSRCAGLLWRGPQDGRQRCWQLLRASFWLLMAHGTCIAIAQVRSHGDCFRITAWLPVRCRCCKVL